MRPPFHSTHKVWLWNRQTRTISTSCLRHITTSSNHMFFRKANLTELQSWTTGCFPIRPLSSQWTFKPKERKSEGVWGQEVTQDSRRVWVRTQMCFLLHQWEITSEHRPQEQRKMGRGGAVWHQVGCWLRCESSESLIDPDTNALFQNLPRMHRDNLGEKKIQDRGWGERNV